MSLLSPSPVASGVPAPSGHSAVLQWHQLLIDAAPAAAQATLPPGLTLLVDPQDMVLARLLPLLTGRAPLMPGGQVACAGLDSVREGARYGAQVCWHNPRQPMDEALRLEPAQSWVDAQAARWPQWDAAAWQQHVHGWALAPHLHKQLWQLSTGTLRKLWMAAALASGARLTVLDEPLAGLDADSIRYLVQALQAVGDALRASGALRWVLVAHYEPMPRVGWDQLLQLSEG